MSNNETSLGLAGVNLKEALFISLFGALGGLLSYLYAIAVGLPLFLPWMPGIPVSMGLGVGAAIIGVYVIANSDTRAFMRCLGFALLCGFSWKPIYDAGTALIDKRVEERQKQEALNRMDEAMKFASELSSATAEEQPKILEGAVKSAIGALEAVRKVDSINFNRDVIKKTDEIVEQIQVAPAAHPTLKTEALKTLKEELIMTLPDKTKRVGLKEG